MAARNNGRCPSWPPKNDRSNQESPAHARCVEPARSPAPNQGRSNVPSGGARPAVPNGQSKAHGARLELPNERSNQRSGTPSARCVERSAASPTSHRPRSPSSNAPRHAQPRQVAMGDYGQTDWGETDPNKNPQYRFQFNEKRWENVNKQLEEIKQRWGTDPDRPLWALLTCETGYNNVVKVGIECVPKNQPHAMTSLVAEKRSEVRTLLRGEGEFKTRKGRVAHGDGDLDVDCIVVRGLEQLNVEHIQRDGKFSNVVKPDIDPGTRGSLVHSPRTLEKIAIAAGRLIPPGERPVLLGKTQTPVAPIKRVKEVKTNNFKYNDLFVKPVEDAKKQGMSKKAMLELIEELYDGAPTAAIPSQEQNGGNAGGRHEFVVPGAESLVSNLDLVRNSQGVAWLIFDLKD